MKIILRKDIEKAGKAGEIVEVKRGYAVNYLIPRGDAVAATSANMKVYEREQKVILQRAAEAKGEAQKLADSLSKVSVTASVQVGEEEKVFGAITSQNIVDLLAEKGVELDRRKIVLDEPLKSLGVFDVPVKVHPEVEAMIKVWVVRE